MRKLSLALDWTPNTNHTGFYVAIEQGFYQTRNIELEISIPPPVYVASTADDVMEGRVDIGMGPSEYVIHSHQQKNQEPLIAIATTLGKDASAFISPAKLGIKRPRELDGKTYVAYDNIYEAEIIRQLIKNDGGKGEINILTLDGRFSVWPLFLNGTGHATWIFLPWEKFEADQEGLELNVFSLEKYGVPYGYSPVLFVRESFLQTETELLKDFLFATRAGFEFALQEPDSAADILLRSFDQPDSAFIKMVCESQQVVNEYYLDGVNRWGIMEENKWADFYEWLAEWGGLTEKDLDPERFYRNLLD
jgi:ABC-type nitrate/sulfonate/bicarbonate transport system substrate-binding protein